MTYHHSALPYRLAPWFTCFPYPTGHMSPEKILDNKHDGGGVLVGGVVIAAVVEAASFHSLADRGEDQGVVGVHVPLVRGDAG